MALEPVRLDDLTWQGMVEAIRRRIPAASGGRWTLHAPVDPGVTLLELWAALLEQRAYQLDQTPDALLRAVLALLGEAPRKTAAASTVLAFARASFREVGAETEMRLTGRTPRLVVSTGEPLTLLPLERLELAIDGRDRTQDLLHGRLLRLFPADGGAAEARLVLWLTEKIPVAPPGAPLGLLVELDAPERIRASWDLEAVDAPPPAQVLWEYAEAGSGRRKPFPAAGVKDGTGGLRRSGLVRLPIPADWQAETDPQGLSGYAIHLRVERATWSAPPRLAGLAANAVAAAHRRRTRKHSLQLDWLPLPGREISLSELPAGDPEKDHPPLADTIALRLRERDHGWQEWQPAPDLGVHGPADRVFEVDRTFGVLRFGNGLNGRQPVLAPVRPDDPEDNGEVEYEVGGGPEGNVGSRLAWEGPEALAAVNLVPARGGAEAQTLAAARDEVSAALRRPTRAVLRRDFEELARTTPGVAIARAHAAVGLHPGHPCRVVPGAVTVFVVPEVPREDEDPELRESAFVAAPVPDPGALAAVQARLDAARLVTTEVFVAAPRYRPVSLRVEVEADPLDPAALERRLEEHLRRFLDPLTGGDGGDGWPFGEPLRPSALLREAQEALGRAGEVSRIALGLDGEEPSEDCKDVAIGEHELVVLSELRLDLRRAAPTRGGLR
jgi:predicted phage baseplate assembly protein